MFRELNALLDLPETHLPTGRFVLIKDTLQADGAVLLPHFLFGYLKTGKRAALLGLEQSVFHYTAVGRKLVRAESTKSAPFHSTPLHSISITGKIGPTPPPDSWAGFQSQVSASGPVHAHQRAIRSLRLGCSFLLRSLSNAWRRLPDI